MSEVTSHILAVTEPNKLLREQADSIVKLAKSLENIPVEAKKSWADLVDEEIDHAEVPSPTIVADFINENNVEKLIDVIATVWTEAQTQSLDIKLDRKEPLKPMYHKVKWEISVAQGEPQLVKISGADDNLLVWNMEDLDLVSESCAKLFIKIRKTYPNTPWPLAKAFVFVQQFQPYDTEVQEDLKQLAAAMEDSKTYFDDNSLSAEQKQQLDKVQELEVPAQTELLRYITLLACRKTPSAEVHAKLNEWLLLDTKWDFRLRYIATLFLAMANCYVPLMSIHEKIFIYHTIYLSKEVLKSDSDTRNADKRTLVQFAILSRIGARMANTEELITRILPSLKDFFHELRDIVLEPNSDRIELALVDAYLDVLYHLALKRGTHVLLSKNTNAMDFLFSCLKNESPAIQKAALRTIGPILEGSPMTKFIGKNRCIALMRQLEVHMNKTWLIKSGDLIRIIGLLSTEFNEQLKHLKVVEKYAPLLNSRYDGKDVQLELLKCLQKMTFGRVEGNPNTIEGITMVHAVPGVFENVIRIVRYAPEGTDLHKCAFRLLAQLIIPNTAIIEKIYATGAPQDVRKALLSEHGLHLEAVYFVGQLVQYTFDQAKLYELIEDFYAPILQCLKKAEDVSLIAYGLIALSLLAKWRDFTEVKQILACATTKTKDNENVLDIITAPNFLFSLQRDIRCSVFKVISSLSKLPSTAKLLVDYGLVPPLVQVAMFDTEPCFQHLPCTPQYHALMALNNIVVYVDAVKQMLRSLPMFLMAIQQDAVIGSDHPIVRAKAVLVANVVRDQSSIQAHVANQWEKQRELYIQNESAFLAKHPEYAIKNTVKKEIVMPDDLFSSRKPKGPQCSNPICPNKEKKDVKILNCARCGQAGYCSKECQQTMWPIHKNYCKK